MKPILQLGAILMLLAAPAAQAQQNASVTGQVTDADDGQPLAGASVRVTYPGSSDFISGTATDVDGNYTIGGIGPGTYNLVVSFVGYTEARLDVELTTGERTMLNVELQPGGIGLDDVVISASRRQEKALEAPASISVLNAEEIAEQVAVNSVDVLRTTAGVDIAQTGIDRQEVVLRGFNNAFSGAAYVLTDYRQGAVASLGVNAYNMMPIASLDLERIEVVRGPGSALYGPGVDAGVIHFISKDPFTYPGTSIAVSGGERSFLGVQGRHAGVVSERLGYKIVGQYTRADDWELDPSDSLDANQLRNFHSVQPRDYDVMKANVNGMVEYRFRPGMSLIANGGYSTSQSVFLSGIGTLQADGFGYTYGQLRFQAGDFFAQAYLNKNEAGDSFVYASPSAGSLGGERIIDNSTLFNAQAQYGLDLFRGRENLIFGADYERTTPKTEGTITGRNDPFDTIEEIGAYAQSETDLTDRLSLTLAARADYDNIYEKVLISPRAGLVFLPTPEHSFRVTFNRAFSSPGTNSLFLDIIAAEPTPARPFAIRARGSGQGFTFARNPAFGAFAGTDLVAYSLNPATPGVAQPAGLPLDAVYASIYGALTTEYTVPEIQAILAQNGIILDEPTVGQLVFLLDPTRTQVQGFSDGAIALLNVTSGAIEPINPETFSNIEPLAQTTSQTIEIGYKGAIGSRVALAIDGYYTQKKNFGGPLYNETPFVFVPTLRGDLSPAITTGIENNAQLAAALEQMGIPPALVAQLIVGLADSRLPSATTPVAIVEPTENLVPGQIPELLLSYRNVGDVDFYGADISAEVLATEQLRLFGNLSWVSDDYFDNEELNEADENVAVALNASALKWRAGFFYDLTPAFGINAAARYTDGYPVRSGPYVGEVDSYFLLDVGAGYDFDRYVPGLRVDATVYNVLDDMHREFIGAPKMGRLALLRLTYTTR